MRLERLTLRNFLSFRDASVDLRPVNILIGENNVGKSNLIDAISLLQAAPTDLLPVMRRGGAIRDWIWKGERLSGAAASVGCDVDGAHWEMEFTDGPGLVISRESLSSKDGKPILNRSQHDYVLDNQQGPVPDQHRSMLSIFKSPSDQLFTPFGRFFESIRIYREFRTGVRTGSRQGIATNGSPGDYLSDGGDNLALVLNELIFRDIEPRINAYLKELSGRIEGVKVRVIEGIAVAHLRESGLSEPVPSHRMSDGTLKFLCLLAVLLHPDPPPVVCLEEPEQGLHPDAIQILARILKDASLKSQIIITTHSVELIDEFSSDPESVVVCERSERGGTELNRLSEEPLREWLEEYSLGRLWRKGEIGGNRW